MSRLSIHRLYRPVRRVLRRITGAEEFYGTTSRYVKFEGEAASAVMNEALASNSPLMAARFGSVELDCVVDCVNRPSWTAFSALVRGEISHMGWTREHAESMETNAGFFPADRPHLLRFSEMMLADMRELDILGSWLCQEGFVKHLYPSAKTIKLRTLEPFWSDKPWSRHLKGKRVLVIHPFESTIRHQFERRTKLFSNPDVLPDFDLRIIRAVQSIAGNRGGYKSWFDALDYLKSEIAKQDFDVAILGCGAYGFPLAAHIKRLGKKSVHMGGATQLLFGIKGARWEAIPDHAALFNEHWIRPLPADVPQNYKKVEGGCYW